MFTLADTDTDKMGLQPISICVGVYVGQSEQFCILIIEPIFIGVYVCVGVG